MPPVVIRGSGQAAHGIWQWRRFAKAIEVAGETK